MIRKIIEINEEKRIGCGLCADACHETFMKNRVTLNCCPKLDNVDYEAY